MPLRVSCADSTFPKLSHAAALMVIADLGIRAVDVCSFTGYPHTPPEAVLSDPRGTAEAVRRRIERFELAVADAFLIVATSHDELAVNHPDPDARRAAFEYFERFVEFSRRIGAPGITVLPGRTFEDVPESDSFELAVAELARRAAVAGDAGLRLAFEPCYGTLAQGTQPTLELLDRLPGVGLTLDYSHFVYQGIAPEQLDELLPFAHHFHVRQAGPGEIQARTHEGVIDFPRVRDKLLELGYTGYFALEYQWDDQWLDFSRVDCIAETAEMRDVLLRDLPRGDGATKRRHSFRVDPDA